MRPGVATEVVTGEGSSTLGPKPTNGSAQEGHGTEGTCVPAT
jgi:hypothetical protein